MSQSYATRTYMPPPVGSFDPYTAAITGGLPSFFSYGQGSLVPAPPISLSELSDLAASGGGGQVGDATVGGGTGYGPIGSTPDGGLTGLGPNPGNLGNLGGITGGQLSSIGGGAMRGASLGGFLAGPPGAAIGALVGGFRGYQQDQEDRASARAHAAIHMAAVQEMLDTLAANEPSAALADAVANAATATTTPSDVVNEQAAIAQAIAAAQEAQNLGGGLGGLSAADAAQAQANAVAANIDADAQPGGLSGLGGDPSGPGPGQPGGPGAHSGTPDGVGEGWGDPGGGGGGGGDSKIVCTAMNAAYGFGSYRNKIWLAYAAKNLTKAHEVGYHTIFQPLVKVAYYTDKWYSKYLRNALEHIARHRSADLKAEMRNSTRNKVGRVYRTILEPICYLVGKVKGH